ncbi:hypothetical protein C922_03511 [Plasmodium inui San Antonio 1]|uniref:Uncharacterized protein n=1 Tax=Plasmodium inui San Antonio 1 TaxID=1237626 RepID=W7AL37_9APIC|nr:hypothetical protein C922_03511 [Plasmodium inui San Antonio 1]EUD66041.1 hypothetical protein C922_03511 [Plasmodium inui San Antonio 1]
MCYLRRSLSKSLNSLVLHFEFVKCKNLASYQKKGKYYMIISYDKLLFYEKDFYEVQFQIFFSDIRQIYICDESNYVHVTLKEGAAINDIGIKGINKSILVKQLCVAYSTYYMFNLNMNIYVPITNETYEERCRRTGHHSQPRKVDLSVQPFIGYRKVVFDEYFFFIHKSFQNFASVSSESTFYIDHRGIEISIKIDDQKSMIELDGVTKKSKTADSNFYQLASSHLNFLINDSKIPLIIRKNFYYKRMNLSDDLAKWSGYEIYLKNETHTIVCIIFRRTFIPPLLDKSQDIFITFKISHQSQQEFNVTDKDLHAEVYVVANSMTPSDIHNAFYANLIQVQVDALLYNSDVYAYFESALKIKPSYFDHLKIFFKSMLVILKEGDVVINSEVMDFLGEDTKVERNLDYLLNVILNRIPGVNLLDTHRSEQIKINRVLHRLSDYLLYCLDSGFLSEKFNVTNLVKGAIVINADSMLPMNDVLNFLLHLRKPDYSVAYRKDCLELLQEEETPVQEANATGSFSMSAVAEATTESATREGATPKCVTPETATSTPPLTKIERLLESEDHSVSDFFLFHLHQCGYINQHCRYKHDTSYRHIIACILKYGTKNVLITLGIHKTCTLLILSNDYDVVDKIVLLYINLSKSKWMCEGIVNSGILLHMMDILLNIYSVNLRAKKEICINILCVIGQVCNYCRTYAQFLLTNYVEIVSTAICIYQSTDIQQFKKVKLIYFFKKILRHSYEMKEKICLQLCPLIMMEMHSASEDKDFIYSSLSLFDTMCCYKVNCLHLERMQIIPLLRFVKSLKVVELYKRAHRIEATVRKNAQLR